jgi:GntR family transcriptional regulator
MSPSQKRGPGRPRRAAEVSLRGARRLDRGSAVPLYFQLGTALRERLDSGTWAPGARFPTEREITEEFAVSRSVIRRALAMLVGDGVIELKRGAGAFVMPPRREFRPLGLVRALIDTPAEMTLKVRAARKERPTADVAGFLELRNRSRSVSHVTALLEVDDEPVCILDSFVRIDLVPWLPSAVDALLRGEPTTSPPRTALGKSQVKAELSFFSDWGGPQLGLPPGDPALIGKLVQWTRAAGAGEAPIEFAHLIFRPDRIQLVFDLDRS